MSEVLVEARADALQAELEARRRRRENQALYARDPILWMNDCVWVASKIEDDLVGTKIRQVKMRVWPDQVATIGAWIDLERLKATGEVEFANVLIEKSRQIGETWGLAATIRWLLRFQRVQGLYMHTKGGEVYDRDLTPHSFFGRVKYIDDHLEDRNPLTFRPFSMDPALIYAPGSGAALRGELQRDDPGRGGTFDFAIVDEAAHVTHGEQVHSAITRAATTGKLYLSTPEGDDNFHARLCDDRPKGWEYLRLHWSTHPAYGRGVHVAGEDDGCELCVATKAGVRWDSSEPLSHRYPGKLTSPWYDEAVLELTDEQVAGELDIDRAGALSSRVYGEFEHAVHVVEQGIEYEPTIGLELFWDFGLDCTAVGVLQNAPQEVRVLGLFEAGDTFPVGGTPDEVSNGLHAYLTSELGIPVEQVRAARSIGDPAGQNRELTGPALFAAYRERGWVITAPSRQWARRVDFSITSVKNLLLGRPKPLRVCGVRGRVFAKHMLNNVWPTDGHGKRRQGSAVTPLDNVHNHACRAFAYWAVATYPPARRRRARGRSSVKRMLPRIAGLPGGGSREAA